MNRKGIKIPSKKFHEFVENFMKSLGVKGLSEFKLARSNIKSNDEFAGEVVVISSSILILQSA